MRYPVTIKGYEGRLELEYEGWFGMPRLLLNGEPVEATGRRGPFALPREGQIPLVGSFRYRFLDPIPKLQVAGETIPVVPAFRWYEWILVCLPILVVFRDPIVGALLAALGASLNAQILRHDWPSDRKLLSVALVDAACFALYYVIITVTRLLVA